VVLISGRPHCQPGGAFSLIVRIQLSQAMQSLQERGLFNAAISHQPPLFAVGCARASVAELALI
jgi:hypothetical protein